jgi:hypothetical protein
LTLYVQSGIIINVKRNTNTELKGRKARYEDDCKEFEKVYEIRETG